MLAGDRIAELLNGCDGYEKKVIKEVVTTLRDVLRNNRGM